MYLSAGDVVCEGAPGLTDRTCISRKVRANCSPSCILEEAGTDAGGDPDPGARFSGLQ